MSEFVRDLARVIDTEAKTIRETVLSVPGKYTVVNVICKSAMYPMEVMVDKLNQVYLPARFSMEEIDCIVINGERMRVTGIDTRYEGDVVVHVVCQIEKEKDHEADS